MSGGKTEASETPPYPKNNKLSHYLLLALIGFWAVFRFYGLADSPYGFCDDESSGAMHFICQAETGANAFGKRWPLFTNQYDSPWQEKLSAGMIPPTYYYIGSLWVRIFGGSIRSIRAMNNVAVLIFILFLYLFTAKMAGSGPALYAALAASLSPWLFLFGRLGTMAAWGLAFLAPACYFFLRSNTVRDQTVAGALLALMACTYPPLCLYAPFLLLLLFYFKTSIRGERLPWRAIGGLLAGGVLFSIPLLRHLSSPEGWTRARGLSIFSDHYTRQFEKAGDYLKFAGETFWENIARHFAPEYLLVSGDANICHSTQYFGEWGWIEAYAIIAALCCLAVARLGGLRLPKFSDRGRRYFTGLLVFCLLGYLCGIIPAASITEGVPHAVRSLGALPFLFMAAGLLVWWLSRVWGKTLPLLVVIALAYTACFPVVYFSIYPKFSDPSWGADLRRNAEYGRHTGDWKPFRDSTKHSPRLSARYFLIQYAGENITSSEARLDSILNQ